jgi:hypothetical protein
MGRPAVCQPLNAPAGLGKYRVEARVGDAASLIHEPVPLAPIVKFINPGADSR